MLAPIPLLRGAACCLARSEGANDESADDKGKDGSRILVGEYVPGEFDNGANLGVVRKARFLRGAAVATDADVTVRARHVAAAAVQGVGFGVDALVAAARVTVCAIARASHARVTGHARQVTTAAVHRVVVRVDAHTVALGTDRACACGVSTNVAAVARHATTAAVERVTLSVGANAAAVDRATCAFAQAIDAYFAAAAREATAATVQSVCRCVDAAPCTRRRVYRTVCRAAGGAADLACCAGHVALTAVEWVVGGIDTDAAAIGGSAGARAGAVDALRATRALYAAASAVEFVSR